MPFTIGGDWISEPLPTANKLPIKIVKEKRRGSYVTVILNLASHHADLKKICSSLKQRLACGGSVKEDHIELQGDQIAGVRVYLKEIGLNIR